MADWRIREAREEDAAELARIEAEIEAAPWSEKAFRDQLASGWPLLVLTPAEKESDAAAGYAAFMPALDELELLILGVEKTHQRQGIARAFMTALLKDAFRAGCGAVHLEVRAKNEAAIGLYEKLVFALVGRRRGYYLAKGIREDALLMRLDAGGLKEAGTGARARHRIESRYSFEAHHNFRQFKDSSV